MADLEAPARFRLGLERNETQDAAIFEVSGSTEWLKEVLPAISYVVGRIVRAHGEDAQNAADVGNELAAAWDAANRNENYQGKIVSCTIVPATGN